MSNIPLDDASGEFPTPDTGSGLPNARSTAPESEPAAKSKKPDGPKDITERDIKLLWGRAGNRCSFPKCPRELTIDSTAGDPSVVGEMAHIVGEKPSASRGNSVMHLALRNTYTNLILLCPTHHTIIDKAEMVTDYPVEVLHEMKETHEAWVRERLGGPSALDPVDPSDLLYADLVDRCSQAFMLSQWKWFASNAVRQILPEEIDAAQPLMAELLLGTLWPKKHLALEHAIKTVATAFLDFVIHFRTKSMTYGAYYKPDHAYKKWPQKAQVTEQEQMNHWHQLSFWLLQRFACHLNTFAAEVRKALNPMYYLLQGDFLLHDELGIWHHMDNIIWNPELDRVNVALSKLGYTPRA